MYLKTTSEKQTPARPGSLDNFSRVTPPTLMFFSKELSAMFLASNIWEVPVEKDRVLDESGRGGAVGWFSGGSAPRLGKRPTPRRQSCLP